MTTEQLNQARASAWHQAGDPLLTADDAAAWLRETGVALFLPRAQQLATAAPSFVEATIGAGQPRPAREAIENASGLLERLLESGDAIALNLLGTPGEQPDFLATVETLPFLFALLGDKEWKRGPRGKSSPLTIEVWKLLDREGPLTTIEVKEKLGRQLTEAAALRALGELWLHMRVEPVFKAGEPAGWQLLERRRQKEMQAGSTMSQAVALSALVSLYLQSAVAASGEEIEIFLSPVASRSKVREVVRGLTATRQLSTLNLGPVEMYHVEGSLPEFPEILRAEGAVVESPGTEEEAGGIGEGRKRFVAKRLATEADVPAAGRDRDRDRDRAPGRSTPREAGKLAFGKAKPAAARRPGVDRASPDRPRAERPGSDQPNAGESSSGRPSAGGPGADRRPFAPRPGTGGGAGERRPYGMRKPDGASSFNPREPWKEDRKSEGPGSAAGPARPRRETPGEGKPFPPREGGERRPFAAASDRPSGSRPAGKSFGERKPFVAREGGARKPFSPRAGGERKPFAPREGSERKPFSPREGGERKPFSPREGAERKPFTPREGGERKSFAARSGDRPFNSRSDTPSSRDRKPFTPRDGAERKSSAPRAGGSGAGREPGREPGRGERKPFSPGAGARPFKPRGEGKPFGDRKTAGDRKPFAPREGSERRPADRTAGARSFKPGAGERKSFVERKPFAPREGGERKPFAPREGGQKPFSPRPSARPRQGAGPGPGPGRGPGPGTGRSGAGRGEGRPFAARPDGSRAYKPREGDGAPRQPRPASGSYGAGAGARPRPATGAGRPASAGARKPTGVRKTTGASRARTSPTTSSGKPRSGVRPPAGRPGPRAGRSAGGIKRAGRPGKGRSK